MISSSQYLENYTMGNIYTFRCPTYGIILCMYLLLYFLDIAYKSSNSLHLRKLLVNILNSLATLTFCDNLYIGQYSEKYNSTDNVLIFMIILYKFIVILPTKAK